MSTRQWDSCGDDWNWYCRRYFWWKYLYYNNLKVNFWMIHHRPQRLTFGWSIMAHKFWSIPLPYSWWVKKKRIYLEAHKFFVAVTSTSPFQKGAFYIPYYSLYLVVLLFFFSHHLLHIGIEYLIKLVLLVFYGGYLFSQVC